MQPSLMSRIAYWRRLAELYRRHSHTSAIHPAAEMPVDVQQIRELAEALEGSPATTRFKVAILEAETFGPMLVCELITLVENGLRLQALIFREAKQRQKLARTISEDMNGAPMNRLFCAMLMESINIGANCLLLEKQKDVAVSAFGSEGSFHSERLPATIPENLWNSLRGWAMRTKGLGWQEMLYWYEARDRLPVQLQVEITDSTIALCW